MNANATCNACPKTVPPGHAYFCRECWFELPAPERAKLYAMHNRKQCVRSKLDSLAGKLREKRAGEDISKFRAATF